MKTILYATDLTEQSVPALRYAYELSTRLGTELIVLNVHQMPQTRVPVTRMPDQIELQVVEEQKEVLKAYCAKHLGRQIDGSHIGIEVENNDSILNGIFSKAKQVSPDLVLIGRKDKHTDRGLFAGDIGQALVKRLTCPVLILPNNAANSPINTILYATDFEEADILAIQRLTPVAKILGAKIHVVHIATEKQYAGKDQMEWFKEMLLKEVDYENLEFKVLFSDHIVEKLTVYAQLIHADLVAVLYREEKGFFQKFFTKSMVTQLDAHIDLPLLSMNKAS